MNRPKFYGGMWRLDIGDIHFCSQTLDGLEAAVKTRHPFSVHESKPEPVVELTGAAKYLDTLRYGQSLAERQDARRRLLALGGHDHLFARPLTSPAAVIAKKLGKPFDDLTIAELTQHVNDIVLRHKLILELSDRHTILD